MNTLLRYKIVRELTDMLNVWENLNRQTDRQTNKSVILAYNFYNSIYKGYSFC